MEHSKIAIVTDSCGDLPLEIAQKYNIYVLPMLITTSKGSFRDQQEIQVEEVYELLKTELPKSSTPLGEDISSLFAELKEKGYQQVLGLFLSSGLSSTYNHILLTASESGLECCIIDSLAASIAYGATVWQAALWREEGMSFTTLCNKVQMLQKQTKVFFSINTLEYLAKGGRINRAVATAGTMLNIKPILSFDADSGEIYVPAKLRFAKHLEEKLIHLLQEYAEPQINAGKSYNIILADGGNVEDADHLEETLKQSFPDHKLVIRSQIGATLGLYLGPRLLGAGIQFLD